MNYGTVIKLMIASFSVPTVPYLVFFSNRICNIVLHNSYLMLQVHGSNLVIFPLKASPILVNGVFLLDYNIT